MSVITLTEEQEKVVNEAVHWFHYESEQLFEISGGAGVGKSVTIYAILARLGLDANSYMAMSYTGKAAIVMRTKGFTNAKSIHSSLYEVIEVSNDRDIMKRFGLESAKKKVFRKKLYLDPNIKLLFIDEAYMVPKKMVKDILSFGIKTIVCGDANQLPPIGDEPGFLTGYNIHWLTQLMRQAKDSPIVYLANRASKGEFIHCGTYGNDVMVITDDELIPEMVGFADCFCCGTNHTRDTLNNWVRYLARYNNSIFPILGERVICRNNNWDMVQDGIALANGLSGYVVSNLDISKYDGKKFFIDFKPDLTNTIFYNIPVDVRYFKGDINIKNEMRNFNAKTYDNGNFFDYSYALTTHLAQGGEFDNGIYIEEFIRPQINNQLNYTGITRFKKKLIYVKKASKNIYIPEVNFNETSK